MVRVNVNVRDPGFADRLTKFPAEGLHRALVAAMRDVGDEILAESQDRVPRRTGTLAKSGSVTYDDLRVFIGYNSPYALFVHEGTRPHEIRPRTATVLAFPPSGARAGYRAGKRVGVVEFGGKRATVGLVYAMRVMHPGTKPVPYLLGAVEDVLPKVGEFFRRHVEPELRAIEKP